MKENHIFSQAYSKKRVLDLFEKFFKDELSLMNNKIYCRVCGKKIPASGICGH